MSISSNTNKVIKDLEKFGQDGIDEIKIATFAAAEYIERESKEKARSQSFDTGKLSQSIKSIPLSDNGLSYVIQVGESYGGYVEFGTGRRVSVPKEMQKIASEIRKRNTKGTFQEGLKNIEEWCKKIGIPKESAYPIFMSILNKGLRPRPFLYPSFLIGRKQYLKDLKTALKRLSNKFNK